MVDSSESLERIRQATQRRAVEIKRRAILIEELKLRLSKREEDGNSTAVQPPESAAGAAAVEDEGALT